MRKNFKNHYHALAYFCRCLDDLAERLSKRPRWVMSKQEIKKTELLIEKIRHNLRMIHLGEK